MSHDSVRPAFIPGLMQDWPLTIDKFLEHANRFHGHRMVVSRRENETETQTYANIYTNAKRTSKALLAYGIGQSDVVATLAMNSAEHLTAWYGICGIGAICHTLNPRLFRDQLIYIINHAGDKIIFADGNFAQLLSEVLPSCPTVQRIVFFSEPNFTDLPIESIDFSSMLREHDDEVVWGDFDEKAAAGLCYTSGTTGNPKGVLYSHRSNYLHTLVTIQPDVFGFSAQDCILPAVPLYHANAWAVAFAAPAVGAKLVMPGGKLDGRSLFELMEQEAVTIALGVPSVWLSLLNYVEDKELAFTSLKRVIVGGAACSQRILDGFAKLNVEAFHAWGMTEMSPTGVVSIPTPEFSGLPLEKQMPWRLKQGRPFCGVDLEIFDEDGAALPHNGKAPGRLMVRGASVASGYFRSGHLSLEDNGYFDTGDIATIDALGFMKITDRQKDVIKSGGEWISSLDIENAALQHPAVAIAAAIGTSHPHWGERPILYVQPKPGAAIDPQAVLAFLADHLAKWCIPDQVHIASIPLGPTGKVDKIRLRTMNAREIVG